MHHLVENGIKIVCLTVFSVVNQITILKYFEIFLTYKEFSPELLFFFFRV